VVFKKVIKHFEDILFWAGRVLSLLFAVLYGISSIGLRSSKEDGWSRSQGVRRDSLKLACTVAFIGILVSFSCACVAPLVPATYSKYGTGTLIVPAGLLVLWWY
jgi:hypothetical protein